MKTLAQIRAANALDHREAIQRALDAPGQGDALSGFPMIIKTDGVLAALAFAVERKRNERNQPVPKHGAAFAIAGAIAAHLSFRGEEGRIAISEAVDADTLVTELATASDASALRRATAEALAFLSYLKRFVA